MRTNSTTNVSTSTNTRLPELIAKDKTDGKQVAFENKKGAHTSLKAKFENFKAKITGGESKQAVRDRLASAMPSGPMTKDQTAAALNNIRDERTARNPAREIVQSARSKSVSSGSTSTRPAVINKLLIIEPSTTSSTPASPVRSQSVASTKDSPPPNSLHDPLNTSKETDQTKQVEQELDVLLDDLDTLVKKQVTEKPTTMDKGKEAKKLLNDPPTPYSLHDPLTNQDGPPPPSYKPDPPTADQLNGHAAKQKDAQSGISKKKSVPLSKAEIKSTLEAEKKAALALKDAIRKSIFTLVKKEPDNHFFTRENSDRFITNLDKYLGLAKGKITFDEASFMNTMAWQLTDVMSDEEDFNKLTLIMDNAMAKSVAG